MGNFYAEMDQSGENKNFQSVSDFFEGRSVLLTGASGFLGTVLLEILLRCCPGIASIYILLRSKGGFTPEQRKELIFEKKVFTVLKDRNPEVLKKVHVVSGDMSKPELGMSEENLKCITEQVSIVYHCAANLSLLKPVRYLIEKNGGSIKTMIELCRKMSKFCVLVYTSTFYSNCNHIDFPVKEEVYRLPFHAQKFLDVLKDENDDRLLEMVSMWKMNWPCWYPFSKCLAENIIQDMASDLPVAIIRPSLVGCTWKSPMP
ncbi:Fatty acyl-CoA reductase 1, partial [Araneus ventricosus]